MKNLQGAFSLCALALLCACSPATEQTLTFDVPYGHYETVLRKNVTGKGQLTCKVTTDNQNRGEKWVPSVILAAAEDQAEDDTLFLSSYSPPGTDQRVFNLRTFNKAKPIIDSPFHKVPDQNGVYRLRLTWQADGAIGYQVASGDTWDEKKIVQAPGFTVRHVSVHASGMKGSAVCELRE
ncbi:hypothetical protein [Pseudomonas sp. FP2309]|uniref:hypothetical protein n=1 Tax=unclassified Pseudomonas TaxID=196821 RepID=UPI0020030253|nr:hypothetical protein [Pseudomonas sp. FP2309]WLH66818.1 hypothetical protein PSH59_17000 [Pseudomonas sp. FP2309]